MEREEPGFSLCLALRIRLGEEQHGRGNNGDDKFLVYKLAVVGIGHTLIW